MGLPRNDTTKSGFRIRIFDSQDAASAEEARWERRTRIQSLATTRRADEWAEKADDRLVQQGADTRDAEVWLARKRDGSWGVWIVRGARAASAGPPPLVEHAGRRARIAGVHATHAVRALGGLGYKPAQIIRFLRSLGVREAHISDASVRLHAQRGAKGEPHDPIDRSRQDALLAALGRPTAD